MARINPSLLVGLLPRAQVVTSLYYDIHTVMWRRNGKNELMRMQYHILGFICWVSRRVAVTKSELRG